METTNNLLPSYAAVINAALPRAIIKYCELFDDYFHGWDICPTPGVLIVFNVSHKKELYIKIEKKIIKKHELIVKEIFKGDIPAGEDGPDLDFIKKVLINWNSF